MTLGHLRCTALAEDGPRPGHRAGIALQIANVADEYPQMAGGPAPVLTDS